jgi:hypothetical protein
VPKLGLDWLPPRVLRCGSNGKDLALSHSFREAQAPHFHDLRAKSASEAETDQAAADRLGHDVTQRVYRQLPEIAQPATLPARK